MDFRIRCILILMLLGTLGCIQTDKYEGDRSLGSYLESAIAKNSAAKKYVQEGDNDKAVSAIKDATEDLEGYLDKWNRTEESVSGSAGVLRAKSNLEAAVDFLNDGNDLLTYTHLELAGDEMLDVLILLMDTQSPSTPARFSVTMKEVPVTYYGYVDGVYLGYQIVPHNVAEEARKSFYRYKQTNDRADLERGIFLTEYLLSVSTTRGGGRFLVWENNFEWPVYALEKGWIGSLSQAGCIKALMLAYQATGDDRYKDMADKALEAFGVDVTQGGLRAVRMDGSEQHVWYPEYAKPKPPYVLNGFITAVIWLGEYHEYTGNQKAKQLYEDGLESIIHFLPSYNQGKNWSYYDAEGHKSSLHYHTLHIDQMEVLLQLTGNEFFSEYEERWRGAVE